MNDQLTLDELYQQGLQHYNRGEWQAAVAALTEVQAAGLQDPHVERLLADARFKQQLDGVEPPVPLAPPTPRIMRILVAAALILLVIAAIEVAMLVMPRPPPTAAVVHDMATRVGSAAGAARALSGRVGSSVAAASVSVAGISATKPGRGTLVVAPFAPA